MTEMNDFSKREEQQEVPKQFFIGNAGLSLISPWLQRLFIMVGYLDNDRKAFKDTESQIRAVFLLQYLTCLEEKEYQETELVFNRLLVALPMHTPLPEQLDLTDEEKRIAESLLNGVKSNWDKMRGSSMTALLLNFILRKGQLEEQEEIWTLTVEDKALDILLDSLPWFLGDIRFPWLKKYIQVNWHKRHMF